MSKKKIVLTVFELFFVAAVPLGLVIANYTSWGEDAGKFKIAFTGILLLFVVLFIVKKIFLSRWLERARATLTQHKADLRVETDEDKRKTLAEAVKRGQTLETLLGYVFPLLLLAGLYVLVQALETAAVQLSGTVALIAASMIVGALFGVLAAREV